MKIPAPQDTALLLISLLLIGESVITMGPHLGLVFSMVVGGVAGWFYGRNDPRKKP